MAAGDTLRRITAADSLILDSSGNLVGVKNPNASGSDLRFDSVTSAFTALQPYTGNVATGCGSNPQFSASFKQLMSRTQHIARSDIARLQLVLGNWSGAGGTEGTTGAVASITAAIEYGGTFTQVKFSGSATGSIPDQSNLISDMTDVSIPSGATFYVRTFFQNTAGVPFGRALNSAGGEAANFAASGLTDQTMGGTITFTNQPSGYRPQAIIAQTTQPSILLLGDSRMYGQNDSVSGTTNDIGEVARSLNSVAYMNCGFPGEQVTNFAAGAATSLRGRMAAYCSHIITQWGTNDLVAGRTAAQVLTDLRTVWTAFPTKPSYQTTIAPRTTSSDSWATVGNQTALASEAQRLALNALIRATPTGASGYLEVADQVESGRDSGKWKANYTSDGIHESQVACLAIQSSGAIVASGFVRR